MSVLPLSGMKVPSLVRINERVKAYVGGGPSECPVPEHSETKMKPFYEEVHQYWSETFGYEIDYKEMNAQTHDKFFEVIKKNVFVQVIFKKAIQHLLEMSQKDVMGKVNNYREKRMNIMILVLSLVMTFLKQGFIRQATGTRKQVLMDSLQCSEYCFMAAHGAAIEGEDLDRKAFLLQCMTMSSLAIYIDGASDDEIDLALGLAKQADREAEPPASGGGSEDTSKKRADREAEPPASGGGGEVTPKKRAKPAGKQTVDGDDALENKGNDERLREMIMSLLVNINNDPCNTKKTWTFDTVKEIRELLAKCKDEGKNLRVTHVLEILDRFQKCYLPTDYVLHNIVLEALRNLTNGHTAKGELANVTKNAISMIDNMFVGRRQ